MDVIMLDDRYTPYDRQSARIENLCGSFLEYVHTTGLQSVISKTNGQRELFHLHGNMVINQGRGSFLAVRGMRGLEQLSRAVSLSTPRNVVHMVVLTSKIGKRVQVSSAGLLETCLARQKGTVHVMGRMYEHTNSVAFSILRSSLISSRPPPPYPRRRVHVPYRTASTGTYGKVRYKRISGRERGGGEVRMSWTRMADTISFFRGAGLRNCRSACHPITGLKAMTGL